MHTPSWLLKIVVSYLTGKTMKLSYLGEVSASRSLPAGSPEGSFLGGLIFIINFNGAFLRPPVPRPISFGDSQSENVKYIDDGSVAVGINLKTHLVDDPNPRPRPVSFQERTGHYLPHDRNLLQYYVTDTENFA